MISLANYTNFGRRYVRDGCTGKIGFATYAKAEIEIGRLIKKNATRPQHGTLMPYACGYCHCIHLGHVREAVTK